MTLNAQSAGLVALFVDYDNVYLSLKRRNEEAALRFAKNVTFWLKQIETGLLVHDRGDADVGPRRLALLRCYGNPVVDPRHKGETDEGAFVHVRSNFMRAGFEIIDCPPLTSRLKNSSDIRIALEIQDLMQHPVPIEEFIILSSDADFTPVLHRLRAHGRRTTIFTTRNTATPYTAVSDGEIHEEALIDFLLKQAPHGDNVATMPFLEPLVSNEPVNGGQGSRHSASGNKTLDALVALLLDETAKVDTPPLLSYLADRAQRTLGAEATSGSNWCGYNSFRNLLENALPAHFKLSSEQPYRLVDASRFGMVSPSTSVDHLPNDMPQFMRKERLSVPEPFLTVGNQADRPNRDMAEDRRPQPTQANGRGVLYAPKLATNQEAMLRKAQAGDIHRIISQIHEKTQLPALAPTEYRLLFQLMADEIKQFGHRGKISAKRVLMEAQKVPIDIDLYDVKYVLDMISKSNPRFLGPIHGAEFGDRFFREIMSKVRTSGVVLEEAHIVILRSWFVDDEPQEQFDLAGQSAEPRGKTGQTERHLGAGREDRYFPQQAANIYLERMQRRASPRKEPNGIRGGETAAPVFENRFMPDRATRPQDILSPDDKTSAPESRLSQWKKVIGRS